MNNLFQIQKCIDGMSVLEKKRITESPFETLWKELWGRVSAPLYRSEESTSSKKFDALTAGVQIQEEFICLKDIVRNSETRWEEQEWEFPKGRRNYKENDMDCALREFEEETGLDRSSISMIENVIPYEEYFIGSNFKAYKHKFYLACSASASSDLSMFQRSEVSKLAWMDIDICKQRIRPYNLEKLKIISNIHNMLSEYSFYS